MAFATRAAAHPVHDWVDEKFPTPICGPDPSQVQTEARKVIESIICSIDRIALDAATVMSGINTLSNQDRAIRAAEIAKFVPVQEQQLLFMFQTLSELSNNMFPQPIAVNLVLDTLHDGRQTINNFVDEEKCIGRGHARIIYAERLKIFWTRVCTSLVQLINETNVDLRLELPLAFRQNSVVLISLLSSAFNGLSPCINETGQLYSPELPQQRKWPRHTVLQNCHVECEGETYEAFVQDASVGGLGLENLPNLRRNAQVKVTMESGRVLEGVVMWSIDNRAGVRFSVPLPQSDPLLTGPL